jgi:hypothetical protein
MTMKDDELSRLQAAFTAPPGAMSAAWSPGSCPEPDRIWEAVRGELPPEEVREIVDHVAVCASCAEDWRIAVAFEKESQAQQEREAVVYSFPTRRFQPWIAAAAAALVLTVGGVYVRQTQKPVVTAEYRGEKTEIRSLAGDTRPLQAFVLSWTPVEGAESYDLLVTTIELDTVADPKGLTTTQYQVPASALAGLPAAAQLHWRVTAVFPDGERKQSPTFTTALE